LKKGPSFELLDLGRGKKKVVHIQPNAYTPNKSVCSEEIDIHESGRNTKS